MTTVIQAERRMQTHSWGKISEEPAVEVEIRYDPRLDYGRVHPLLEQRGALGLWCEIHGSSLTFRSVLPLELSYDAGALSDTLDLLPGDPGPRSRMPAAARSVAALLRWEETVSGLYDAMREAVSRGPDPAGAR